MGIPYRTCTVSATTLQRQLKLQLQDILLQNVEFVPLADELALQNDDNWVPEWCAWDWADYAILDVLQA
jgi:hypothetical protein